MCLTLEQICYQDTDTVEWHSQEVFILLQIPKEYLRMRLA